MTLDSRNMGTITGGLTSDPEIIESGTTKIIKLRLAADRAGQENRSTVTGYFDVVFYASNPEDQGQRFVVSQITEGKMRKGSQISVAYRLVQERWRSNNDEGRSKVTLVADSINYFGFRAPADADDAERGGDRQVERSAETVPVPNKW